MSYDYKTERQNIFTEGGQVTFLAIRDRVNALIGQSGAVTMSSAISGQSGDTWALMASVDRMVEIGELVEVQMTRPVAAQNRIFTKA